MPRPIAFDVTHLASRLPIDSPSGIDKVDLAYARHFSQSPCAAAVHYGLRSARFFNASTIPRLAEASAARWGAASAHGDELVDEISAFVAARGTDTQRPTQQSRRQTLPQLSRHITQLIWRLSPGSRQLPHGAIYLNVAQHVFENPKYFRWLDDRRDVLPVFMVHDMLPLDMPEYFRAGYHQRFTRRTDTIVRHAQAIIATSQTVADRIRHEYARRHRPCVRIHVEPLPSSLPATPAGIADPRLNTHPYFVILGTVEPRKNHLLLLNVWRRLAEETAEPPKLLILGSRGWDNEQVVDVLDRSILVRPHVCEVSRLDDHSLLRILANSRGLLMPSFAEGYGLPIVEALSLGVPVVASQIPVFQEVSQGRAILIHPLDGLAWKRAIVELSSTDSPLTTQARDAAAAFRPPSWDRYFEGIRKFLDQL